MAAPSFALHEMGWHAFQQLCHTVLREVLGQVVVSFLDTKDGGRDGAFAGRWVPTPGSDLQGEFVVQCKHTSRAGHSVRLTDLSDELDKAAKLVQAGRCDVYVLITNAGVTGENERLIAEAFRQRGVKHVLVLGATWINQTIAESSRLRRLVPRLYGLGDLTQILDERAYRQARAVLDAMRTDLAKLVLTGTYERAAHALADYGFLLLIGAAAAGKTTIAAQLALGAADEFDTAVVKLDSVADFQSRWNPDERQLFWLDDVFGTTQFDRTLARAWTLAVPRVAGAVKGGALFVLTSRDYVFRAAREHLKPGSFPLLHESQVVVDVADLTIEERRQILYNHLRHGRQPNSFLTDLQPHLESAASHPGFAPELARRLSDPLFTKRVAPRSSASVADFLDRPSDFLRDVMMGLDSPARAALGLIFIDHNWVPSPIQLGEGDADLLDRLGSDLGGVTQALEALAGSLVQSIMREGSSGWVFSHPTMVDAYADLLRTPELLHHLIDGFPLDVLLREVTCGDVGVGGAVVVPPTHFERVLDRLDEPLPGSDLTTRWRAQADRTTFLSTRCDSAFLETWLRQDPNRLDRLAEPGLMLEANATNELVARLNEYGLFPDTLRRRFAAKLIEYCVTGEDPAVLWNDKLASILTDEERTGLLARVRTELLGNLPAAVEACTNGWDGSADHGPPEGAVEPLRTLVYYLPELFPADSLVEDAAKRLDGLLDDWVVRQDWEEPEGVESGGAQMFSERAGSAVSAERSLFDDLLEGRPSD
jgi:hypothetical protein